MGVCVHVCRYRAHLRASRAGSVKRRRMGRSVRASLMVIRDTRVTRKASKDEAAAKEIASRQQDMVAERRAVAFEMIGNVKGVWRERQMSIVMVVEKKVFFAELRSAVENRSTTRVFTALTRLETERPSMYVREAEAQRAARVMAELKVKLKVAAEAAV